MLVGTNVDAAVAEGQRRVHGLAEFIRCNEFELGRRFENVDRSTLARVIDEFTGTAETGPAFRTSASGRQSFLPIAFTRSRVDGLDDSLHGIGDDGVLGGHASSDPRSIFFVKPDAVTFGDIASSALSDRYGCRTKVDDVAVNQHWRR